MNSIVTFYSYKGGVGRSMALANVAILLGRRGLKVLVVDWDLEAPGIERYFGSFEIISAGPGLLRMFLHARDTGAADYRDFVSFFSCDGGHPITLLASGRDQDPDYSRNLENFHWEHFFLSHGGSFIEGLRERWKADFDIVLIDSRTGLSDTGGICTIQMPDIVVAMFTANYQSLFGVRDVMRLAQKARQALAYDRMPLSVFPLPARWGTHEFQETKDWLDRIAEASEEFYVDWLPSHIAPRSVLESVKIPQIDYFGFGEKLAVVDQGTTDPQGMGFVYNKVASFLASDLREIRRLVDEQAVTLPKTAPAPLSRQTSDTTDADGYLYDVFASYDRSRESVLPVIEQLRAELKLRGRPLRIFVDVTEIQAASNWAEQTDKALLRSRVVAAFLTSSSRPLEQKEAKTFLDRSRKTSCPLLAFIMIRGGDDYWNDLRALGMPMFDMRRSRIGWTRPGSWITIGEVAKYLIRMVDNAPPHDDAWTLSIPIERVSSVRPSSPAT